MVILDTSIIIDHLRSIELSDSVFTRYKKEHPTIKFSTSMISVQELYSGRSMRVARKKAEVELFLHKMKVLDYDEEVALLAGNITLNVSYALSFADAAIAATAIVNGAPLFTLNVKHFSQIEGLRLI